MENPFSEAIKGVRTKLTRAIDVSDLLLGDLLDKTVIDEVRYDQILVRCFTVSDCLLFTAGAHCFYASRQARREGGGGVFPGPATFGGAAIAQKY